MVTSVWNSPLPSMKQSFAPWIKPFSFYKFAPFQAQAVVFSSKLHREEVLVWVAGSLGRSWDKDLLWLPSWRILAAWSNRTPQQNTTIPIPITCSSNPLAFLPDTSLTPFFPHIYVCMLMCHFMALPIATRRNQLNPILYDPSSLLQMSGGGPKIWFLVWLHLDHWTQPQVYVSGAKNRKICRATMNKALIFLEDKCI